MEHYAGYSDGMRWCCRGGCGFSLSFDPENRPPLVFDDLVGLSDSTSDTHVAHMPDGTELSLTRAGKGWVFGRRRGGSWDVDSRPEPLREAVSRARGWAVAHYFDDGADEERRGT